MMKQSRVLKTNEHAFTIIELMIATTVVSVVLLLASVIMINIGGLYYKGISQSRVQGSVRSITDEVAQQLRLTDSGFVKKVAPDNTTSYCIGTTRYTYILGKQLGTESKHVLWRDNVDPTVCPDPSSGDLNTVNPSAALGGSTPGTTGAELIAPRSRLTVFNITPAASPYNITVDVAFGDIDLLCDTGPPTDCNSTVNSTRIWNLSAPTGQVRCKGSKASPAQEYCGTANLTTTVVRRLP